MNNKKKGSLFEIDMIRHFGNKNFWVRAMFPDNYGNQPFDVLAIKGNEIWAFDCKTTTTEIFYYKRIEQNQFYAMKKFKQIVPQANVGFFIQSVRGIYYLDNSVIDLQQKGIKLNDCQHWC